MKDEQELLDWIESQGGTPSSALVMLKGYTDMITKAYSRGVVEGIRINEGSGVRPVVEDWHGKGTT